MLPVARLRSATAAVQLKVGHCLPISIARNETARVKEPRLEDDVKTVTISKQPFD